MTRRASQEGSRKSVAALSLLGSLLDLPALLMVIGPLNWRFLIKNKLALTVTRWPPTLLQGVE